MVIKGIQPSCSYCLTEVPPSRLELGLADREGQATHTPTRMQAACPIIVLWLCVMANMFKARPLA